jgi:hypothetical protein
MPEEQGENRERVGPGSPPVASRFKPGQSGNPGGRPKGSLSPIAEIRRQLAEVKDSDEQKRTRLQVIVANLLDRAENDSVAARDVLDRVLGRPRQTITLDSDKLSQLERKLQNFMAESEADGDTLTRIEAIAILTEEDADFEMLSE